MDQEAYLLRTGNIYYTSRSLKSLSPDGRTKVVGAENYITVFNAITGNEEKSIDNVHSAGDKHIHVFHNVTGYRATVADLEEKEKKASGQAMKERIRQQIVDAKSSLSSILEQANGHAEIK